MATVTPVRSSLGVNVSKVFWEAMATSDTINTDLPSGLESMAGSVQVTGTFDSATVTLTGSNDGTNYVTLKDSTGAAISMTVAGLVNFSASCAYIKPGISGGGTDDIDVTVIYRNQ